MFRKPFWLRRVGLWPRQRYFTRSSSFKKTIGTILCIAGLGIAAYAIPGWLYIILFGLGLVIVGMYVMQ